MFVAFRAIVYSTAFIAFLLIYLPARVLSWSGIIRPATIATPQIVGIIIGSAGAAVALWCVFTFVWLGKGTPAPFDPPHRLVVRGPYQFVRNPMYLGAGIAIAGAAVFYNSITLFAYSCAFFVVAHLFVLSYEEPKLQRTFGSDYDAYRRTVGRWWPRMRPGQ